MIYHKNEDQQFLFMSEFSLVQRSFPIYHASGMIITVSDKIQLNSSIIRRKKGLELKDYKEMLNVNDQSATISGRPKLIIPTVKRF